MTGIIILAHGSPNRHEYVRVMEYIAAEVKKSFASAVQVVSASLNLNHPDLEEAIQIVTKGGARKIVIMPFFIFEGKHSTEDIPNFIEKIKPAYPDTEFVITRTLGTDKLLADITINRIKEVIEQKPQTNKRISLSHDPEAIEARSMEIIERLLPSLECSDKGRRVIKRIVHASGDVKIAGLVKFHPRATISAISAIKEGKTIFTDVKMVATGINSRAAAKLGCSINCAIDEPAVISIAEKEKITKAAAAMRYFRESLNGAIVVIGNAPTALFELIDLIDNRNIKPAIIIGIPVGFVGATESKLELMKRDVPYIVVEGTRGGSALAAAATNALLKICLEDPSP